MLWLWTCHDRRCAEPATRCSARIAGTAPRSCRGAARATHRCATRARSVLRNGRMKQLIARTLTAHLARRVEHTSALIAHATRGRRARFVALHGKRELTVQLHDSCISTYMDAPYPSIHRFSLYSISIIHHASQSHENPARVQL